VTDASRQGSRGATTAQERFAYHRHAAEMARVREVSRVALVLTVVMHVAFDVLAWPELGRGALSTVIAVQVAMVAMQGAMLVSLFREPLPPAHVVVPTGAVMFVVSAIALSFIGSRIGGLTSPVPPTALALSLMVQVLALPRPWRDGAVVTTATGLAFPLTTLALTRLDDRLRAELANAASLAHFATVSLLVMAAAVLAAWGGHIVWALRQSAFENKSIGRYRLLRRIGKGGMGEVWRAHDRAIRRDVALKLLSPDHRNDPDRVARFEREIEATAELTHPNTVRIHDWGVTHDGVWYYAMELLDGVDLATLVRRHGKLPPAQVVRLGLQAAKALAEAHDRGIVHRDVKPANLFAVALDGAVDHLKVLDFGVARVDSGVDALTQAGAVVGTPGYLAPEVAAGIAAGPPADVWSLAATLYLAATGEMWATAAEHPAATALPRELAAVLHRALEIDPARRPRDAGELAELLTATRLAAGATGELLVDPTGARVGKLPDGADQLDTVGAHQPTVRQRPPA
jgi:serine/threonine-protein kinase